MAGTTVKAWQYTNGYPSTLHLSSTTLPTSQEIQQSKDSYLVKIQACALNPVDIQYMNLPLWNLPLSKFRAPKGTVMDFAGTVIEAGNSGFKTGDEILGMTLRASSSPAGGALGEIMRVEVATTPAVLKPQEWSWEKAAGVSLVWLTAKACVERIEKFVEKSERKRVAVLGGSSAVGIYVVKIVKRKGWKVVATSSGRNKDFLVGELGVDEHVDYTQGSVRGGVQKFGPDAVVDCVGGTEGIGLEGVKRYISIVGDKTGRTMMGGPYTYYDFLHPLTAAMQWVRWAKGEVGLGESYDVVILSPRKDWLEEAKEILSADELYVDSVFAFEDAKKAFERLNTGRAKGKVVIDVAGDARQEGRITLG